MYLPTSFPPSPPPPPFLLRMYLAPDILNSKRKLFLPEEKLRQGFLWNIFIYVADVDINIGTTQFVCFALYSLYTVVEFLKKEVGNQVGS